MAPTPEQLFQVLQSTVDPTYLQPFLEQGPGSGLEAFEALTVVLSRVADAIERNCEALFIQPWSGQLSPPAMGAALSTVQLQVQRGERMAAFPLTLKAGQVLFEEVATDWGKTGGVETRTGRRFTLQRDFTFLPGQVGPVTLPAVATLIGYGPANILPGTITGLVQPGATFSNGQASVAQNPVNATLQVAPQPDVIVPQHVGQYVALVGGANVGAVKRVAGYTAPNVGVPDGGTATLAPVVIARNVGGAVFTQLQAGESVEQYDFSTFPATLIAKGVVLASTAVADGAPWYLVLERTFGQFQPTIGTFGPIDGLSSTASFPVEDVTDPNLVDESGTASWRVLDWAVDWGLQVTNPDAPAPGAQAMLDALGEERKIARAPGEDDASYRKRVAQIADTVCPNAIRRIGNRIWSPYGQTVCLREIGLQKYPGFYFDGNPGSTSALAGYAWDLDGIKMRGAKTGPFFDGERVYQDNGGVLTTARVTSTLDAAPVGAPVPPVDPLILEVAGVRGPGFVVGLPVVGEVSGSVMTPGAVQYGLRVQDRFKTLQDYTEFRAFFLLGVPPSNLGEFGLAYDDGVFGAYDASPYLAFYDGFPLTAAVLYRATWQAVDRARAAGVGFDLYVENKGCS